MVLSASGWGIATTESFTVHSRRWTIDYLNVGRFLEILPLRGSFPTAGAITATKRGAGSKVMTGAGTFRLKVGSTGQWTIRVRDRV